MATLSELQDKWESNAKGGKARAVQALQDADTAADYISSFNDSISDLDDIDGSSVQAIKWALAVGSEAFETVNPGDTYEFTVDGESASYTVPDWSGNFDEGIQQAVNANKWSRGLENAVNRSVDGESLDVDL